MFYRVHGAWRLRGVVTLYILRTALMNCTYPVEESILMDYVPKNTRARWKSLESVSQFGWCGSALAGGLLADRYGYARTCVEINQYVRVDGVEVGATIQHERAVKF